MKQAHSHHSGLGGWMAGLVALVVILTLWMAWRLGGAASIAPELRFQTPSAPSRTMPNPQPTPLPISPGQG